MKTFNGALLVRRATSLSLRLFRAAALTFLVSTLPMKAATLYVNSSQTNNPSDGLSWNSAFKTVKQALVVATNGTDVWVARGIYPGSLVLSNGVALYGGFAGNETALEQRDWLTNQSVLDAQQTNSVVTVVVGSTNATRIDGLVLRNGRASLGGGIYCSGSAPTIVNNRIIWNTATNSGGGIYFTSGSPVVAANLIQGNISIGAGLSGGAGIGCVSSSPKIINNRILANRVNDLGIGGGAGGVSCFGPGSPEILGNVITANRIGLGTAGINLRMVSSARVVNNTIAGNNGRGISCDTNSVVIANNILTKNTTGIVGVPGLDFRNNCTWGNDDDFSGFPDPTGTNGNITVDPLLAQSPNYPEFHLLAGSPCIDAGDSSQLTDITQDLDGEARVAGSAVDIGADEFDPSTPALEHPAIHVSPSGNDANDGKSWAASKQTVQGAMDEASICGGEVWVAGGVYTNNLTLRHFVSLYGGFAGTETQLSERNWKTNASVLDGNQQGSVISADGVDEFGGPIDGFVIRNGKASLGAGIFLKASSPTIANNVITNNTGIGLTSIGGGIYALSASPNIASNIISFNQASHGGGVCCVGGFSQPIIKMNVLERNAAVSGFSTPGGLANGGGAIFLYGSAQPLVEGNLLISNSATNPGGSLFTGQGGAICISDATATIINNTLVFNVAASTLGVYPEQGGGIYSTAPSSIIANNLIAFGSSGVFLTHYPDEPTYTNVFNNCVFGNGTNYLRMPNLTGTNRNFSADPGLISTSDFRLSSNSPCINSGDTNYVTAATDLGGDPRIVGSTVDVGAYEFQFPESVISYAWLQQYGLPTDGSVDFSDGDNDQANTWAEWKAWTDPTDEQSVLRMLSALPGPGGTQVSWQSVPSQTYCLERATNPTTFSLIQPNVIAWSNLTTFTDVMATNSAAYYYRVGVGR